MWLLVHDCPKKGGERKGVYATIGIVYEVSHVNFNLQIRRPRARDVVDGDNPVRADVPR